MSHLAKTDQDIDLIDKFVEIFVTTQNAAYSYRAVFDPESPRTTIKHGIKGRKLLREPQNRVLIDELRSQLNDYGKLSAADVFNMWATIATADVDELVGLRVGACRYCYGVDHAYQWTPAEYADALADFQHAYETGAKNPPPLPDVSGGLEYDATLPPVATCPECRGEGVQRTVATDTSQLSPTAKLLYGGVKKTKYGIEIIVADKTKALENVTRMLGAYKDEPSSTSTHYTQNNYNISESDAAAIYEAKLRNPT